MLSLSGQKFSLEQIVDVARGVEQVEFSDEARERVAESRRVVEEITESGRVVYGVNTGFGKLADFTIAPSELRELQLNLVRSHACGVGPPLSEMETGAMTLEALRGTPVAFDERIHAARPHPGQVEVAAHLRELLSESEIRASHVLNDPRVQDAYSLRCMPQVHGAVRGALHHAREIVETETGSATDNPLVFANENEVLSGGNFHGAPLALAFDYAAFALTDLISITERRIDRLVNPDANEHLPPFLTSHPGAASGFMMMQIVAASLLNEAKVLAHPSSIDNIPTDGGKEDHVSMGMTGAVKLRKIVELAEHITAIELICAAEGLEYRKPLQPGRGVKKAYEIIRRRVVRLTADRAMSKDIEPVT